MENIEALDVVLTDEDLNRIDEIAPPGRMVALSTKRISVRTSSCGEFELT